MHIVTVRRTNVMLNVLNVITIIVIKMTSHWAGTVQMREESESGIKKVRRDVI